MSIHKTATRKLAEAGHPNLSVKRGIYGYYVTDDRYQRQQGTRVQQTAQAAVYAVLVDGQLPIDKTPAPEPEADCTCSPADAAGIGAGVCRVCREELETNEMPYR